MGHAIHGSLPMGTPSRCGRGPTKGYTSSTHHHRNATFLNKISRSSKTQMKIGEANFHLKTEHQLKIARPEFYFSKQRNVLSSILKLIQNLDLYLNLNLNLNFTFSAKISQVVFCYELIYVCILF